MTILKLHIIIPEILFCQEQYSNILKIYKMSENILQKIIDKKKIKIEKLKHEIDVNRLLHSIKNKYYKKILLI